MTPEQQHLRLDLRVNSPELGYLNVRRAPQASGAFVTTVPDGATVTALEPEEVVRRKVGQHRQWLNMRPRDAREAYAAAWYLECPDPEPEQPPEEQRIARTVDLTGTERQVALTWNRLGGLLRRLADSMAFDPGIAAAVLRVESGGRAFGPGGRMIIRFESHILYGQCGQHHPETFAQYFTFDRNRHWTNHRWRREPSKPWRAYHGDQSAEWDAFDFASALNDTAARLSISMGSPQIMGFNYAALGYQSVQRKFDAFAESERNQAIGLFDFVRSQGVAAVPMLQALDFVGFARFYNGRGQAQHYGNLIQRAHTAHQSLRAKPVGELREFASQVTPDVLAMEDDIERVLGIGPKTAARLEAEGITTFEQLAALDVEQLEGLCASAVRYSCWLTSWPAQARLGEWRDSDALAAFQADLRS